MTEAQFLAMAALGFGSFIFGLLPIKISRAKQNHPLFLSLLLCFGGGVLLATSLVHMLSEVRETLKENAELYFCVGFFILYTVDELVHYCLGDNMLDIHGKTPESGDHVEESHSEEDLSIFQRKMDYGTTKSTVPGVRTRVLRSASFSEYSKQREESDLYNLKYFKTVYHKPEYSRLELEGNDASCSKQHDFEISKYTRSYSDDHIRPLNEQHTHEPTSGHHHICHQDVKSTQCHVEVGEPCQQNVTGTTGLLMALLVHSILEGIAVGVQPNSSKILLVLGAVSCHKFVVSFCLGVELTSSGVQAFRFVIAMAIFSIGSPIGIAIGMSITNSTNYTVEMIEPYLQAVAGGSLLYVTACEVLPRERSKWQHQAQHKGAGILQLLSVTIGFVFITLLNMFLVSEHDEVGNSMFINQTSGT